MFYSRAVIFLWLFFLPFREIEAFLNGASMQLVSDLIANVTVDGQSVPNIDLNTMFGLQFPRRKLREAYDFVIVGSGPAGCVLANRLSADGRFTVALLEAGRPEIPFTSDIPMGSPNLQSTPYNYGYTTEPQPYACWGVQGRRCRFPHGRALGGSSVINYMIYTRGNRRDFDAWADAGNTGWSFREMLPYFLRSENSTLRDPGSDLHGKGGEFPVEDIPYRTPISHAFVAAAQRVGFRKLDYNSGEQIGVSYLQQNTRLGRRISAARAFLEPIKNRKNLHIFTSTPALKLDFESKDRVTGVYALVDKRSQHIRAKREVILSAGSFESPKLLILSGIGHKPDLKELGIGVKKDLPVGKIMYEHLSVFGPIFTLDPTHDGLINFDRVVSASTIVDYFYGRGPMTVNGIESLLYVNTNASTDSDPNLPDMEIMQAFTTVAFDSGRGTRLGLGLTDTLYEDVFAPLENKRAFLMLPMLLHPKSRGHLKVQSRNPLQHPIFYPNFLTHDQDVDAFYRAIKLGIQIAEQKEFSKLGVELFMPSIRGCEGRTKGTEAYWRCYIKYMSFPLHHQVATCKMGHDSDSVVDHTLRVHGFQNLRVVDTSIIPQTPSGHTSAFSLAIGEKAADLIGVDHQDDIDIRSLFKRHPRSAGFDWQKSEDIVTNDVTQKHPSEKIPEENLSPKEVKQEVKNESSTTEISDLKFILRPDSEDRADQANDATKLRSNVKAILETLPTANEDMIKTVTLAEEEVYGRGRGKPKVISEALKRAEPTVYEDSGNVNETNLTKIRTKRDDVDEVEVSNDAGSGSNNFRKMLSDAWKATNDGLYQISESFRKFLDGGKDREW
ncbi:glucose dehydrogenase [Sergentomyia squamirostris]